MLAVAPASASAQGGLPPDEQRRKDPFGGPWPQHFDGQWWKNEFARRYAIDSIPAMFLLDREGRLVTTNARGEKLETEVRRLLGL